MAERSDLSGSAPPAGGGALELHDLVMEKRRVLALQVDRLGTWDAHEGRWVQEAEEEAEAGARLHQERRELMLALRGADLSSVRRDPENSDAMQLMRSQSNSARNSPRASTSATLLDAASPRSSVVRDRGAGDRAPVAAAAATPATPPKASVARSNSLVRAEVLNFERRSSEARRLAEAASRPRGSARVPPSGWPPGHSGRCSCCEPGDSPAKRKGSEASHRAEPRRSLGALPPAAGPADSGATGEGGLSPRAAQLPPPELAGGAAAALLADAASSLQAAALSRAAAAAPPAAPPAAPLAAPPSAQPATWAPGARGASARDARPPRVRMKGVPRSEEDYARCVAAAYALLGLGPAPPRRAAAAAAAAEGPPAQPRASHHRPRRKAPPQGAPPGLSGVGATLPAGRMPPGLPPDTHDLHAALGGSLLGPPAGGAAAGGAGGAGEAGEAAPTLRRLQLTGAASLGALPGHAATLPRMPSVERALCRARQDLAGGAAEAPQGARTAREPPAPGAAEAAEGTLPNGGGVGARAGSAAAAAASAGSGGAGGPPRGCRTLHCASPPPPPAPVRPPPAAAAPGENDAMLAQMRWTRDALSTDDEPPLAADRAHSGSPGEARPLPTSPRRRSVGTVGRLLRRSSSAPPGVRGGGGGLLERTASRLGRASSFRKRPDRRVAGRGPPHKEGAPGPSERGSERGSGDDELMRT